MDSRVFHGGDMEPAFFIYDKRDLNGQVGWQVGGEIEHRRLDFYRIGHGTSTRLVSLSMMRISTDFWFSIAV